MKYSLWLVALCSAWAQDVPIAFTGARVIPITGPEIPSGTVVVQNVRTGELLGRISRVSLPANSEKREPKLFVQTAFNPADCAGTRWRRRSVSVVRADETEVKDWL